MAHTQALTIDHCSWPADSPVWVSDSRSASQMRDGGFKEVLAQEVEVYYY